MTYIVEWDHVTSYRRKVERRPFETLEEAILWSRTRPQVEAAETFNRLGFVETMKSIPPEYFTSSED